MPINISNLWKKLINWKIGGFMNFSNITNSSLKLLPEHMASEIVIPGLDKSYKILGLIKDLSSTKMGNLQNV